MGAVVKIREWLADRVADAGYPATAEAITPVPEASTYTVPDTGMRRGYHTGGEKWRNGLSGYGRSPIIRHRDMRGNARSAVHDSLAARAIVDRYEQTVVDTGVRVRPNPVVEILGIAPEAADAWARDVASRFDLWAGSQLVTAAEDMTFYQAQRWSMRSRMRDGEYFIRCWYDSRRDLLNPLRLQPLDPNQIMGDTSTDTAWPQTILDGIERDERGRVLRYHVRVMRQNGQIETIKVPRLSPRGLPLMLHGYAPEYAGQARGFSKIGHALQEFQNLTTFTVAQIEKAIVQSSITMVAENDQEATINPMVDFASGPAGPMQAPQDPETTDAAGFGITYTDMNEIRLRPGGVGVFSNPAGQKLKSFENTAPSDTFASFCDAFVTELAASVNMPPEILALKFSQNYSASRAALILFWRTAAIERDEEASDFYGPVYRAWLAGEIAAGRVMAPGWSDPRMRAAWCACSWSGPPMPNIDPAKTAKADKDYVEMGAQSLDDVARNFNGSSGAANRTALARQLAELPAVPWARAKSGRSDAESSEHRPDTED